MRYPIRHLTIAAALLALALPVAGSGSIEGRWLLVEETYGNGGLNLRRDKPAQTLEFVREGGRLSGRTRLSPDVPELSWPSFGVENGPQPVTVDAVAIPLAENGVRTRYRTPAREGQIQVDIVEEYQLSEDGNSLLGTVTVTLLRNGESRGGYVLHRRYERKP